MIAKAKGSKGKCDVLFSRIVRRGGSCERCGSRDYLQCAHIISRRYSATRTDLRNAWSLCAACHRRLTDWPKEHADYIYQTIGELVYEELHAKAEAITKVDWDAELVRLKEVAKTLGVS